MWQNCAPLRCPAKWHLTSCGRSELTAVNQLRNQLRLQSERPFIARGANAKRCDVCLLAVSNCICHHIKPSRSTLQIVLFYHLSEIYKPTNSGRLIADTLPNDTQAFLWHRTTPDNSLDSFLKEHAHECVILYPETESRRHNKCLVPSPAQLTSLGYKYVIVLDASWRQASKMLHQSRYLDSIPTYAIAPSSQRTFLTRHAKHDHQLATAEVVAMLFHEQDEKAVSESIQSLYEAFNQHSLAMRGRHKATS